MKNCINLHKTGTIYTTKTTLLTLFITHYLQFFPHHLLLEAHNKRLYNTRHYLQNVTYSANRIIFEKKGKGKKKGRRSKGKKSNDIVRLCGVEVWGNQEIILQIRTYHFTGDNGVQPIQLFKKGKRSCLSCS